MRPARERELRARLEAELAALPPLGSPALRSRMLASDPPDTSAPVSLGALVVLLRRAIVAGERALVEELFVLLLERSEAWNRRWATHVVVHTPAVRQMRGSVREELKQELTLYLWQRLARERDPAWELYFARALTFAQRRVARSYMERNGYWPAAGAPHSPQRLPTLLLSQLARSGWDDEAPLEERLATSTQPLTIADLADLRDFVARLPERERLAVVMRFWLGAREHEIARALGVTTRTVRNLLRRAYGRLRAAYAGD